MGWTWAEGNSLCGLAFLYEKQRQYAKAAEYYEKAIAAYEKANDRKLAATTLSELGDVYVRGGKQSNAMQCFDKSLQMAKAIRDTKLAANMLGNLGCFYAMQRNYPKAAEYLEESVGLAREIGNPHAECCALLSLGEVRTELAENSKAIECYESALELKARPNDKATQGHVWEKLARLHTTMKNYPKAADYSIKLLESPEKLRDSSEEKDIRRNLKTICKRWAGADPQNPDLKRVKEFLNKGNAREALNEQFVEAIKVSDIEMAKTLLAKGAKVNDLNQFGHTALETAAGTGSLEIVQLLMDSGADAKTKNRYGRTNLEGAYTSALFSGHEKVAQYFLDMGVDVNAVGPAQRTALESAAFCSPEFIKMMIDKGAKVNAKSNDGSTPLMAAARSGRLETVRLLLDKGADVNAANRQGQTALMAVAEGLGFEQGHPGGLQMGRRSDGCLKVAQLLLERGADVNLKGKDFMREGRTVLMGFSVIASPELVKAVLEKNPDLNAKLKDESNALFRTLDRDTCFNIIRGQDHWARRNLATYGWNSLDKALDDKRFEVAELLINHGIDVNAKLQDGSTALSWAAFLGDAKLVKLLLEKGPTRRPNSRTDQRP